MSGGSGRHAPRPIRFGTSGWRGILGDEITLGRVAVAARAVAAWVARSGSSGAVWIGRDRRWLGAELAECAARELVAAGLRVVLAPEPVPTPVIARAVRRDAAAAGLVLTASHNPPAYHGLKVFGADGASAAPADTRFIEARAAELLAGRALRAGRRGRGVLRTRDPRIPYRDELRELLGAGALAGLHVVHDAMHGAAAGLVAEVLGGLGATVETLNASEDPHFGGAGPDPLPERLGALRARLLARPDGVGVATDGDGDRYAAVDPRLGVLSETQGLALLVDHLASTGRVRRGVAVSLATGSLVERVAASHGLAVERHPIGFKHLASALRAGRADVAGEESGGFALAPFVHDKDGVLAACLLAQCRGDDGRSLGARLRALERRHGRSACGRRAVPGSPAGYDRLERLRERPPARVGDTPVRAADVRDGLHLRLGDGFLMLRASGTEGVLRAYAEAPDRRRLGARLALGAAWLGARA